MREPFRPRTSESFAKEGIAPMEIRDRIKSLRRVRAKDLLPHPKNWRTHPDHQREALQGLLAKVGYANALLTRETPEGLMLIDGHLRAATTPEMKVPVLVLDITEQRPTSYWPPWTRWRRRRAPPGTSSALC
jgi:hypothetical protein